MCWGHASPGRILDLLKIIPKPSEWLSMPPYHAQIHQSEPRDCSAGVIKFWGPPENEDPVPIFTGIRYGDPFVKMGTPLQRVLLFLSLCDRSYFKFL